MIMFKNRADAGRKLANHLAYLEGKNPIVLAIPRGGIPIGFEIVKALNADFSLIIARKLPFPYTPESGFGAVAEDGNLTILPHATYNLSNKIISTIIETQKKEIQRRIAVLRGGKPLPDLEDRIVILVDDGIAMGSTMRASITYCKKQDYKRLIVASPVSSPEVARAFNNLEAVDETLILEKPRFFRAVAQVYEQWYDVTDHEVLEIMKQYRHEFASSYEHE
jgi:predicted phosphoribosyltransferase